MQHSDDSNQYEIENKILELQQDVREFWATLNEQGIWLFLATLGCWSVTDLTTKRLAFVATFFIFYETTNNILKPFLKGSSFVKRAKKIKQSIERQLEKSHSSLHLPPSPPILGGSDSQSLPILGDLGFDVSVQPNVDECNVFTTCQTGARHPLAREKRSSWLHK
jgi:hypothetical protein